MNRALTAVISNHNWWIKKFSSSRLWGLWVQAQKFNLGKDLFAKISKIPVLLLWIARESFAAKNPYGGVSSDNHLLVACDSGAALKSSQINIIFFGCLEQEDREWGLSILDTLNIPLRLTYRRNLQKRSPLIWNTIILNIKVKNWIQKQSFREVEDKNTHSRQTSNHQTR